MADREERISVKRIIENRADRGDYFVIFRYIRQVNGINPIIKDIGHFIAHKYDKNMGSVFSHIEDCFTINFFNIDRMNHQRRNGPLELNPQIVPKSLFNVLRSAARLACKDDLFKYAGYHKQSVPNIIKQIEKRYVPLIGTNYVILKSALTKSEIGLILFLTSMMTGHPIINGDDLIGKMSEALITAKILKKEEQSAFKASDISTNFLLHIVSLLHNSVCVLSSLGKEATIDILVSKDQNSIDVQAFAKTEFRGSEKIIRINVLKTGVPTSVFSSQSLQIPLPWDFPVEVKDGRLEKMQ
ncbi:hypothetical protein [Methylocella sp.]|uniref:hypothetical protein n=1 Tax=Methylocella sp. TaxID=1978226 RepID=UPI00378353B4